MKIWIASIAGAALVAGSLALPAHAKMSDAEKAAAAAGLVLLGAAALAHHEDHHSNGKHLTNAEQVAAFDRGFRDGLHNAEYDSQGGGEYYSNGYASGQNERENRLAHRGKHHHAIKQIPLTAKQACVQEAASRWVRLPSEVHVVNGAVLADDEYLVEVAAGYRHGKCEANEAGTILLFEKGTL